MKSRLTGFLDMNVASRLVLGTAQFGMAYGITNGGRIITDNEIIRILQTAKEIGINLIDTAVQYGDSENKLGKCNLKEFKVMSKISPFKGKTFTDIAGHIEAEILQSLERLKIDKLHGMFVHQPEDLFKKSGEKIYNKLSQLKSANIIQNIGVSIYDPDEIALLTSNFDFDIFQVPLNVFDQRFISEGHIASLAQRNISVHVRSIYLQGILLADINELPDRFRRFTSHFRLWHERLRDTGMTPIEATTAFVKHQREVAAIVVGAFDSNQLSETAKAFQNGRVYDWSDLNSFDRMLVDPRLWNH